MSRCFAMLALTCVLASCSLAAQVTVTLASPTNGTSATSPVHVAASASSSRNVTGWRIYIDGAGVYHSGSGSSISANLNMSTGTHRVVVRAWASNGTYGSATASVTVAQPTSPSSVSVTITPTTGTVQAGSGQSLTLTANLSGSTTTGVTWSQSGIGTLSYSGNTAVYTPPTTGSGTASVIATSVADPTKSAAAGVTVTAASASTTVGVSVSPSSASVQAYGSQQFTASVAGTSNTAVTWLVNGVAGGGSGTGTISSSGLYTAPPCASTSSVTITAQSVYDGTAKASSTVALTNTTPSNFHFVTTSGSDSNDGSGCRPWATIQHAASVVNPGDNVIVEDGTYPETVLVNRSGTSTSQISFRAMHKWGAKIAPPQSTTAIIFDITANYVTLQDFEIIGTPNVAVAVKAHYGYTGDKILGNNVHSMGNGSTVASQYGAGCLSGAAIEPGGDNSYTNGNVIWDIGWHRDRMTGGQNGQGQCHMQHGIYITAGTNSFVQNNVIYGVYQGYSIHVNSTIANVMVTNNTLFNGGDSYHNDGGPIMFQCANNTGSTCDYNSFSNNIVSNWQRDPWGFGCFSETNGTGTFGTHNVWANNLTDNTCDMSQNQFVTGTLVNTIVASPQYVNYTGDWTGDYRLTSTSPAIDNATSSGAPSTDYNGYRRPYGGGYDIGAFEWHP